MLEIQVRKGPVSYRQKWFYPAPMVSDALTAVHYFQAKSCKPIPGFICQTFSTVLIDLARDEQVLRQGLRRQTRYEIRRARQEDGISFTAIDDPAQFVTLYNASTKHTGLGKLSLKALRCYSPFLHFLAAMHEGTPLIIHATLMDAESGRARMLLETSLFRNAQTTQERGLFGRAHRFLHWEEMRYFRERGIRYFDLGGYLAGTDDAKMRGINKFKDSFGGQLVEESNYMSYPVFLYRLIEGFRSVSRWRVSRREPSQ